MKKITIVVPMAGAGSRFAKAGYLLPKPMIDVAGRPMIDLVIENLKPLKCEFEFIFICRKEHLEKYNLASVFEKNLLKSQYKVVGIDGLTSGSVPTILMAVDHLTLDSSLLIANSDQYVDFNIDTFLQDVISSGSDGVIMTFRGDTDPKWSFVKKDRQGIVVETAEKKAISDEATVGIYYYKNTADFVKYSSLMIMKDFRVNNEFYTCPVYNEMILDGKIITTWEIPRERMHGLGTPEDLAKYIEKVKKWSK